MKDKRNTLYAFFRELPTLLVTAVIVAFLLKAFVIQPFWIPTGSMIPTLMPNDRVLAEKISYYFREPRPGDIVVFLPPNGEKSDYIKRVVAVEGQKIKIEDGKVFVNGKSLKEPYLSDRFDNSGNLQEIVIPDDMVFVMGDNRPNSMDSRVLGPISEEKIVGRAFMIYWPIGRIRFLN